MTTTALDTLRRLVAPRPALAGVVETEIERLGGLDSPTLERWAGAAARLIEVNAGPACVLAFVRAGESLAPTHGVTAVIDLAAAAANICRASGAAAATAVLGAAPAATRSLSRADLRRWATLIEEVSAVAPDAVASLARSSERVLRETDITGFEAWTRAGLRAAGRDRGRRERFFSLADPLARDLLARKGTGLAQWERALSAYTTALWGVRPVIRGRVAEGDAPPPRRSGFSGQLLHLPEYFPGISEDGAPGLYRAAIAHLGAHLTFGGPRFDIGALKPLQITLISLIEDARVEWLALRRFPGLVRVWAPFHVARPDGALLAPSLMARLARALFDPAYQDGDGWVEKGRRLFRDALPRIDDPTIAREIGGLLGNDMGQMRIRFEPRTHVVEPAYRDDNMGLWTFPDPPESPPEWIEARMEAARPESDPDRAPERERPEDAPDPSEPVGLAAPVTAEEAPPATTRWPEWDHAARISRPDWTIVREIDPPPAATPALDATPLLARLRSLVGAARTGRPVRLRRLPEGDALDLEACVEAMIARRAGETPDPRVHQSRRRLDRDLATLVLLDASASTAAIVPGAGRSIMALEVEAVDLLARAVDTLGDPLAVWAFDSEGRERVRVARLKTFDEGFDVIARRRLAALRPGRSTRLGAAIRHAGAELGRQRADRRLLLFVGDAEPFDIDSPDPDYLIEDARVAVAGLRAAGTDCFCLDLAESGTAAGERIFGRRNHFPVRRLADLPERLSTLYARLAVG